jgi:L-alanine-DL-glutamate epimerase-like enolase superfamily enzyme/catechol 2,3-dioxygenase-like lactoylglutathione lyase family enzyme
MKITGCEIHAVSVNFEGVMPGSHVVLRLRTDQGLEGVSYVSRVGPRTMKAMALVIEAMVESLVGEDPTEVEQHHRKLTGPMLGAPVTGLELRAASAIDVACWDLKGKAAGQPVYQLMGGSRDRLAVSANWGLMPGPPKDKIAAHLEQLLARGFRAVKCPVGFAPIEIAIDHVLFVRSCVGPNVKIIVDLNFQHDVSSALQFARATEAADLYWIEDPVPYHDYPGMRQVTETARQRVTCGEVFQHVHEFKWLLEGRCCSNVMIDQDLGLTGFLKIAELAQAHGCPVVNHLAPEALAHPLAAVPNGLIVGLVPTGPWPDARRGHAAPLRGCLKGMKMADVPKLDGLRTIKFAVADCDRALTFYERVFGAIRVAAADHRDADGHIYAYVCRIEGLGTLDLRLLPDHAAAAQRFDPITLHVADRTALDSWVAHLDRLGDVPHSGIFATGLSWVVAVADPDGRVIKLFSREGHGPEIAADKDNPWMKN